MGPVDIGTILYLPHPSGGMRVRFFIKNIHYIILIKQLIKHIIQGTVFSFGLGYLCNQGFLALDFTKLYFGINR